MSRKNRASYRLYGDMRAFAGGLVVKFFALFRIVVYRLPPRSALDRVYRRAALSSPIDFNRQETVNQLWADHEAQEAYLSPACLAFYDEVANLPQSKGIDCNGKHIADVGCGTGHLLLSVRKAYRPLSMTGLDFSETAIEIARTNVPEATFLCHDIYDSSKEHRFDILFCTETLEHLLFPDRALRNLLPLLNRPGIAVITVPDGRKDTFRGHINFWSPESWEVFVREVCQPSEVETGLLKYGSNFAIIRLT